MRRAILKVPGLHALQNGLFLVIMPGSHVMEEIKKMQLGLGRCDLSLDFTRHSDMNEKTHLKLSASLASGAI